MAELDYKTIAAPRRLKRVKGVKPGEELLAYTISEIIEEQAAEGWRYLRADRFVVEEKAGFFSGPKTIERTVMVFTRERRRTMKAASQAQSQPHAGPGEPMLAEPEPGFAPEIGGARRD